MDARGFPFLMSEVIESPREERKSDINFSASPSPGSFSQSYHWLYFCIFVSPRKKRKLKHWTLDRCYFAELFALFYMPLNLQPKFVCNCICISFFREPGWGGVCPRAEERDAIRVVDHQRHHASAIGTAPNPTLPANHHLYVMRGHHRPQAQSCLCQRGIQLSPEAGVTREQAGVQAEERIETLLQDVGSWRPKGCLQVGELTQFNPDFFALLNIVMMVWFQTGEP